LIAFLLAIRVEIEKTGTVSPGARYLIVRLGSVGWAHLAALDLKIDEKKDQALDLNERKDSLALIDCEIEQFQDRQNRIATWEKLEQESENLVCSVPSADSKVLRYETHIDRLLHRTMLQLERVQNRRKGEPVPTEIARLPRKSPAGYSSASPEASVMTQTTK
jgi:hypothetical protein